MSASRRLGSSDASVRDGPGGPPRGSAVLLDVRLLGPLAPPTRCAGRGVHRDRGGCEAEPALPPGWMVAVGAYEAVPGPLRVGARPRQPQLQGRADPPPRRRRGPAPDCGHDRGRGNPHPPMCRVGPGTMPSQPRRHTGVTANGLRNRPPAPLAWDSSGTQNASNGGKRSATDAKASSSITHKTEGIGPDVTRWGTQTLTAKPLFVGSIPTGASPVSP